MEKVFPTHVGVFLHEGISRAMGMRLPHARGGVSLRRRHRLHAGPSSPRTWGCFFARQFEAYAREVFPTHVGVFLWFYLVRRAPACLPHARGGVSVTVAISGVGIESSPRTWGCFSPASSDTGDIDVFPTHVGVFPLLRYAGQGRPGLPHARGGVSFLDKIWG